jgi:dTDP-glucose 4,6-dehydratase
MARLLVTGGAGFIGANFVHYWLQENPGDRVVVLDALTYAGNLSNLEAVRARPELTFVRGTIGDTPLMESLLREEALDTLVHFAAESHVDRSIAGPDAFIDTNVSGTHSLLKAARRVWIDEKRVASHRFHQVSTDEVYGSLRPEDSPFTESTPYAPNSPYSASKAAADHLVRAYQHTYGLAVTTSCCSNNYGPYQFPEKLIPLMIVHILEDKSLPVYGDGRHVRDWLHVLDHCHGIERVLVRGRSGAVYNLGGRCECENLTLVRKVCQIADECFAADPALGERFPNSPAARGASAELISFVKDRAGHDRRYAIDCSKAERELGFSARTSLAAGLRRTFHWYLEHETWWRAIREGSYRESPSVAASRYS